MILLWIYFRIEHLSVLIYVQITRISKAIAWKFQTRGRRSSAGSGRSSGQPWPWSRYPAQPLGAITRQPASGIRQCFAGHAHPVWPPCTSVMTSPRRCTPATEKCSSTWLEEEIYKSIKTLCLSKKTEQAPRSKLYRTKQAPDQLIQWFVAALKQKSNPSCWIRWSAWMSQSVMDSKESADGLSAYKRRGNLKVNPDQCNCCGQQKHSDKSQFPAKAAYTESGHRYPFMITSTVTLGVTVSLLPRNCSNSYAFWGIYIRV